MLIDELKAGVKDAMRSKDGVAKDVLRVALGEIQTAEARTGGSLSEEEAQKMVRKLVKSNEETLAVTSDAATIGKLKREIEVLQGFLPRALSVDEIEQALARVAEAIRGAKADGPAMGIAMKALKSAGATVEATDVKAAMGRLRS
ncbi:MAG: GatB/YqeY domain-containing protein [Myxococcota bacterium]